MSEPVETRGDDRVDLVVHDANRDGQPDLWIADTDGDGKPDLYQFDTDGDGKVDVTMVDLTQDGNPDQVVTGDGGLAPDLDATPTGAPEAGATGAPGGTGTPPAPSGA